MKSTNPILDDVAGLMTGAMGAARAAGEEARTAFRSRAQEVVAEMDLVGRDEVEALRAIATQALERVEALEQRVAELEASKG